MSQITAESASVRAAINHPALRDLSNITLPTGSKAMSQGLIGVGAVLAIATIGLAKAGLAGVSAAQGLAAVHVGACSVLAICCAATIFVMIFHLLNAGWTATVRRQFENIAAFTPFALIFVAVIALVDLFMFHGKLFTWMDPAMRSDHFLQKKWAYFYLPAALPTGEHASDLVFPLFFFARMAFYAVLWTFLTRRLISLSRAQDTHPDPYLSAKARFTSSWGILAMALSTAFAGFDYTMSLDFRFFSTMWGVYFFAGGAYGAIAVVIFLFARLNAAGKLKGLVTQEHFHDLGKLMFTFTIFWAYIAFSQYFLIWYSNLPEETHYMIYRTENSWKTFFVAIILGHFAFPFLFFISRVVKKNVGLAALGALVALLFHVADVYWIVRPLTYTGVPDAEVPGAGRFLIDALGILAAFACFAGFVAMRMRSVPLVAVNDPWMPESLEHKNYV